MAKPKKGQLAQFMVPMVDATDFATIESAITASDFNSGATVKFYGVNHGGSAATTSGTVSKIASLVRSGVFRITLKGTENNYDLMQLRVNKTGTAEQIMEWENVDNDDSDIMSALTLIQSMASDAVSAAQQGSSRVLLVQSRLSDLDSRLASDTSDIYSLLSDLVSDFQSRVPKRVATDSQLSDMISDLLSHIDVTGVQLNASTMSDLRSAINAITVTITASDISDIASAVIAGLSDSFSDVKSGVNQVNSRVLINQSRISDIQSFLSDMQSDLLSHIDTTGVALNTSTMSDLRSAITVGAGITTSDISDILSAVNVANSRVLINQSRISDIYSLLSDVASDITVMSGVQSDIYSAILAGPTASDISDILSAITANGVLRAGVDPAGEPLVTATLADKVDWLTMMSRNKLEQTSTKQKVYRDDGTTLAASAVVSDDGTTFTRGEFA